MDDYAMIPREKPVTPGRTLPLIGALAIFVWGVILLMAYYHPYRVTMNADDGFVILECAHHSVARDGLYLWGTKHHAALSPMLTHMVLETLGLRCWISHLWFYTGLYAVLLLGGAAWLGRSWRLSVVCMPLTVLLLTPFNPSDTGMLGYWTCRPGVQVPEYVATVFLLFWLFRKLEGAERPWRDVLWLCVPVFSVAMAYSPGNTLIAAVMFAQCVSHDLHRMRSRWSRWAACAAMLAVSYALVEWSRGMYDHDVHRKFDSLAGFDWHQWWPTVRRFAAQFAHYGPLYVTIMVAGVILGLVCMVCQAVRLVAPGWRSVSRVQDVVHPAALLAVPAVMYGVVMCGNHWIHVNPINQTYVLPAFFMFVGAWSVLGEPVVHARWCRKWLVVLVGGAMMIAATWQVQATRPRTDSLQYGRAKKLLAEAGRVGGPLPLLGSFWVACVNSCFDPHLLPAAPFDGEVIADGTLPRVLSASNVYVNFAETEQVSAPPDIFVQRETVLARGIGAPALAAEGWLAYKTIRMDEIVVGSNLLAGVAPQIQGSTTAEKGVYVMRHPVGKAYSEVIWPVGKLDAALYLLSVTARYTGEFPPSDVLAVHVMDRVINPGYPGIVLDPEQASYAFRRYVCLIAYRGCDVAAAIRMYCLARQPYEVRDVGLYGVPLPARDKENSP